MTPRRLQDDPARRDLIATMLVGILEDEQRVQAFRHYAVSESTAAEFVEVTTRLGEPASVGIAD